MSWWHQSEFKASLDNVAKVISKSKIRGLGIELSGR